MYTHQHYIMDVCNCSNDRQCKNNESIFLYLRYILVSSREMTSHIVHQPIVCQFKKKYIVEKYQTCSTKFKKNHI